MPSEPLTIALSEARALLRGPAPRREPIWPTLAAAAFFAVCALTFATASILAPPAHLTPIQSDRSLRGSN
jgi:hypothetical protein